MLCRDSPMAGHCRTRRVGGRCQNHTKRMNSTKVGRRCHQRAGRGIRGIETWRRSLQATRSVIVCSLALLPLTTFSQGSKTDYERAANLSRQFSGKVFRDRVEAHWLTNNKQFWYEVRTGTNTREFV